MVCGPAVDPQFHKKACARSVRAEIAAGSQ